MMCVIDVHDKIHEIFSYLMSSGVGRPLPQDSTINPIKSLCATSSSIGTWLKSLEENYIWSCQ